MGFFDSLFKKENKDSQLLLLARQQSVNKFKEILKTMGITSFSYRLGDENGKYNDTLYILTKTDDNEDVENCLKYSITKPHTAQNLLSVGIIKVRVFNTVKQELIKEINLRMIDSKRTDEDEKIKEKAIKFAESEDARKLLGGMQMREMYFYELGQKLIPLGTIPYDQTLFNALQYTRNMYIAFQQSFGSIDPFYKSFIAYEVSCAIKQIYPTIDKMRVFNDLYEKSIK